MRTYELRYQGLAIGLAALAGFVDALGFCYLGGMFVSFMSGNSTRIAVSLVQPNRAAMTTLTLLAAFVGGVIAGSLLGAGTGRWRKQAVLSLTSTILAFAALAYDMAAPFMTSPLLMAGAMGTANAMFQRNGEVSVGVTYMTGTLVKLGQHLATAVTGGPRWSWVPYGLLWLGFMIGAATGAHEFELLGLNALWIAAGFSLLLLGRALCLGPMSRHPALSRS
ncbi:YoaK family protein [Novosphingobium terrae]|uniref:YoaK family protein n=1 Tax=Novosphingobium terrae TaxID=2726189 RepID=UPI00197D1F90|nr:YoaK family protein [Novosphingobium terrae]